AGRPGHGWIDRRLGAAESDRSAGDQSGETQSGHFMTEFKVPELGENVATGDVTKVLVNVGDTIKQEQPVLELETDKATIEVPSSVEGVVKEIRVKRGDKVKVGAVILTVDSNGGSAAAPQAAAAQ